MPRTLSLSVVLLLPCLLAACGGGTPGALPVAGKATLDGGVTEVDGATSGLGGLAFELVETGERVVTGPDGRFEIREAPAGSFTLALVAPAVADPDLGAQVYADKCSLCHGPNGSGPPNARGTNDADFAAALTRGGMASIQLTAEEYDAVFAFLSDDVSPPPAPPPAPPPTDETDGAVLYRASCASCHGDFGVPANAAGGDRQVLGARICSIEGSIQGTSVFPGGVPEMAGLESLTDAQLTAIAEYLNSQPVTGQERYVANCAGCHGMTGEGGRTGESVRGEDADETREAIGEESTMRYLSCMPDSDLDQIAAYLQGLDGGDDDDDDDDPDKSDKSDKSGKSEDSGKSDKSGKSGKSDATPDEIDDGDESSEREIVLHRVRDGEHIRLRVRVRDGRLERVDVSRSERDERDVEVCLRRTDANDDPDMKGCLEIEQRDDRDVLELEVEHATAGRDLEAFVIDADDNEESLGILTVDLDGEAEWELRSGLPFGVISVADLEGYCVSVRDALEGTDLLVGEVPELPLPAAPSEDDEDSEDEDSDDDDGDDDDGEDDDDDEGRTRGKARLTAHEPGLEGYVEIKSRPEEPSECFEIEAEELAAGREVAFYVEDGIGSDRYVLVGTRTADDEGEAELELDTDDGDSLPGGVDAVEALVGRRVQVRDASTDDLLLDGIVPALSAD